MIIVPIALLLNAFFPIAIKVILILGGLYLAYEGMEKIIEFLFHRKKKGEEVIQENTLDGAQEERAKIKSAITTDFILSVEIVIIALGTVLDRTLTIQILTVSVVALIATVGVYGIVTLIVRMDDVGYRLIKFTGDKGFTSTIGHGLVKALPWVIKSLSVIGTIALLLVSGGIFTHNIEFIHHLFPSMPAMLKDFFVGMAAGLVVVIFVKLVKKILPWKKN